MLKFDHAVIMAAGRGMRMMPLTNVIPKAMAPFNGSTIIADGIKNIKDHIDNLYITVGYKGATLSEHVINKGVSAVFNTTDRGNAWWVYNTLIKNINSPVLVLTCDNIVKLDYEKMLADYYGFNEPACMVIPVKPVSGLEGDYIFHKNNIIKKLDRNEESDYYCSGIQIINPLKINHLTEKVDNFYDLWEQLIKINELYSSNIYPEHWFTVDTIEQLKRIDS